MGRPVYCLLSGTTATGGPRQFMDEPDIKTLASSLSAILTNAPYLDVIPPQDETDVILVDALTCLNEKPIPASMQTWCAREIARSRGPSASTMKATPSDKGLRICSHFDEEAACFEQVLSHEGWDTGSTDIRTYERGTAIFVDLRCWYYLNTWLMIPPLSCISPNRGLAQEFLDLVRPPLENTHKRVCIHPDLDYGPMVQDCWTPYKDYVIEDVEIALRDSLENVPNVRQALSNGITRRRLGPALLRDFRDVVFHAFPASAIPMLLSLPLEISLEILSKIGLADLMNISSTSKSMRQLVSQSNLLSEILRNMVNHGSLRWIKPCLSVVGECEHAH
ncbi:hypothetical protein DL96DRAFT_1581715 [Flagelloscypha sp. PMI_526]|nr:hypothetical protein DL96DRAFT_1581715 [Flagelloscypha sp. PMI_526]